MRKLIFPLVFLLLTIPCRAGVTGVWRSFDVIMDSTSPQATVTDGNAVTTDLEFYESTNNDGVNKGSLFNTYTDGSHADSFNHAEHLWAPASGYDAYPYAAKSTTARGSDSGEANTPAPSGVFDLQLHPPENDHLVVAAFVVPVAGDYSVYDLAVRRVWWEGSLAGYKVFDEDKNLLAYIVASTDQDWVTDPNTYNLGTLQAGDRIYFAVDREDANYWWDATEIIWTIEITTMIDPNLVGRWWFDETSGNIAYDSSGNENHGQLIDGLGNGLAWVPAESSLNFDGSNNLSRVLIPTTGMTTTAGTVAVWANLAEPQERGGGRNGQAYFFGCDNGGINKILLYMSNSDTQLDVKVGNHLENNITTLSTETWYHIALTWNLGTYTVYVNGSPVDTGTYGGLSSLPSTADIGNNGNSSTQSFHGLIDDVMIFDKSLSADEIQQLYQESLVPIDLNNDGFVDFLDYAIFSNDWQKTDSGLEGDINGDNVVDSYDLEILVRNWLCGEKHLEDDTEDSYSCEGDFDASYPCSNAVDEDWSTYALPAVPGTGSYIYENYMIPPGIAMADFTIKYQQTAAVTPGLCTNVTDYWDGSTWTVLNCTALTTQISTLTVRIPDDALSGTTLQLRTGIWKGFNIPGGGSGMYFEGKVTWYFDF